MTTALCPTRLLLPSFLKLATTLDLNLPLNI
jgi:hypothetical protein